MKLSDYIVKNGSGVQWKDGETVKLTGETVFAPASSVTGVIDYGQYNDNVARWPVTTTTVAPKVELLDGGFVRKDGLLFKWVEVADSDELAGVWALVQPGDEEKWLKITGEK